MTVIERRAKMGKNGQKRKNEKKRKEERKTKQKTSCMRAERRPSPEDTRLLSAGTTSPTICLGNGPTEGRHDKTRRKARKEQKKNKSSDTELEKPNKHFYVQLVGQGRHERPEGRQR